MAQVTKNADGTFTLALTSKEQRAAKRASDEPPTVTVAKKIEGVLTRTIQEWRDDFASSDGPPRLQKFDSLPLDKQDAVDELLNGG